MGRPMKRYYKVEHLSVKPYSWLPKAKWYTVACNQDKKRIDIWLEKLEHPNSDSILPYAIKTITGEWLRLEEFDNYKEYRQVIESKESPVLILHNQREMISVFKRCIQFENYIDAMLIINKFCDQTKYTKKEAGVMFDYPYDTLYHYYKTQLSEERKKRKKKLSLF